MKLPAQVFGHEQLRYVGIPGLPVGMEPPSEEAVRQATAAQSWDEFQRALLTRWWVEGLVTGHIWNIDFRKMQVTEDGPGAAQARLQAGSRLAMALRRSVINRLAGPYLSPEEVVRLMKRIYGRAVGREEAVTDYLFDSGPSLYYVLNTEFLFEGPVTEGSHYPRRYNGTSETRP